MDDAPVYDWKVGDLLAGRFEILTIFRGGMGVVYRVRDKAWGSFKALKTFQERFIWNREVSRRFIREAATWVELEAHPNIVRAEAVEVIQGRPCLILEWIDGRELKDIIEDAGILDLEAALMLAIQIADGMAYAQSKLALVHRDLKPSNVLVTPEGVAKVTDFGVAKGLYADDIPSDSKHWHLKDDLSLTSTGAFVGSIQFMSPEQFLDPSNVSLASDIYSFGCCLYQMVTGKLPFEGKTIEEYRYKHLSRSPDNPKMHAPDLPRTLAALILRCLEKTADLRFPSFQDVRDFLLEIFFEETGRSYVPVEVPPEPPESQWRSRGLSMENLGRLDEAMRCYDQAIAITPGDTHLMGARAGILEKMGRHQESLDAYNNVLRLDPTNLQALNNKGIVLASLGRYEEAVACRDEVLDIEETNVAAWVGKGCALAMQKKLEEAITCFERALEVDARSDDAWQNKGYCLEKLRRREAALECYRHAVECNPRSYRAWYNIGLCQARMGKLEDAIVPCKRALEINDGDAALWTMVGSLLVEQFRYDEALEHFDEALARDPTLVRAWYNRGVVLDISGDYPEAARSLRRALGLEPDNLLVKEKLEGVEARLRK